MDRAPTAPAPGPDAGLAAVRSLMEGRQYGAALAATQAMLESSPEHRDALYLSAVNLRYLNRIAEALAALETLQRLHPGFSRLYQERGHCHVALRDAQAAIEAYLVAVNRNPALTASWARLETLYRMTGREAEALVAAEHVATTARLAPAVLTATGLFHDGDLDAAEQTIREYLLTTPMDIEGMRLLARIALERDALDDADFLLESVIELAPDYAAARYDYATALLRRHKYHPALTELDRLLASEPANRTYRGARATAYVGLGDHERALAVFQELLSETPANPELHLSIAHTLKTLGRQAEAIEAYRQAARLRPDYGDAYWSLANLKTYRFTDAEIEAMQAQVAAPGTSATDRYHLLFALGKALEDRGDYEASFSRYAQGNAQKRAEVRYDITVLEQNIHLQKAICTREFFSERAGWGCPATDPIFIVGLPRSGSTLLEQILASHSQVEGTMELADIALAVSALDEQGRRGTGLHYPQCLTNLTAAEVMRLGEKYLRDTAVYRSGKVHFIDKMPNNFRHIGLIHLMLPNARIIDARREPMACCFSNLKQLFAVGQEFTYSIEDIARYYRAYVEVMQHWDEVLPGRVLRVQHEEVVENLDENVRRLLAFCGLPFEAACLEFHKTDRSVRTASSEQVRQPLYSAGLSQWRHFERWLAPLRAALGDLVKD